MDYNTLPYAHQCRGDLPKWFCGDAIGCKAEEEAAYERESDIHVWGIRLRGISIASQSGLGSGLPRAEIKYRIICGLSGRTAKATGRLEARQHVFPTRGHEKS